MTRPDSPLMARKFHEPTALLFPGELLYQCLFPLQGLFPASPLSLLVLRLAPRVVAVAAAVVSIASVFGAILFDCSQHFFHATSVNTCHLWYRHRFLHMLAYFSATAAATRASSFQASRGNTMGVSRFQFTSSHSLHLPPLSVLEAQSDILLPDGRSPHRTLPIPPR